MRNIACEVCDCHGHLQLQTIFTIFGSYLFRIASSNYLWRILFQISKLVKLRCKIYKSQWRLFLSLNDGIGPLILCRQAIFTSCALSFQIHSFNFQLTPSLISFLSTHYPLYHFCHKKRAAEYTKVLVPPKLGDPNPKPQSRWVSISSQPTYCIFPPRIHIENNKIALTSR